jgi:hypothetical protein
MDYEVVSRIAERIADHDMLPSLAWWKCRYCGISGDGIDEWAVHVARELASDFGLVRTNRWVPFGVDGTVAGLAVESFDEAEKLINLGNVVRVDREYQFSSRWISPSRERTQ